MKKILLILSFISGAAYSQNTHLVPSNPLGQRVMTNPSTGANVSQAEILHQPVQAATNVALPANTYANNSGFQSTLTGNSNGALPAIDSYNCLVNDRILVRSETDSTHNGIYIVTQLGTVSTPYILTRGTFSSIGGNLQAGTMVWCRNGATFAHALFAQGDTASTITIGTTKLWFNLAALDPSKNLSDLTNVQAAVANLGVVAVNPLNFAIQTNNSNPGFLVMASAIIAPTSSFVINQPIVWGFITSGGHGVTLFDSVGISVASPTRVRVFYPNMLYVYTVVIGNDETTEAHGITIGPTVATNFADFQASQPFISGITFHGNGTTTWVQDGTDQSTTLGPFSTADGGTSYTLGAGSNGNIYDVLSIPIIYEGPNQYTIDRQYTGLGSANGRFNLVTPSGGYLNTNPTTADRIVMWPLYTGWKDINLGTYSNYNGWLSAGLGENFWIIGLFEAEMVSEATSTTTVRSRWQSYAPASAYKLYRGTDKNFGTQTLVYSGTALTFTDTGLTPNTQYWYKLITVEGGVDTDHGYIFPVPTNF